jgi:hypothetical protein
MEISPRMGADLHLTSLNPTPNQEETMTKDFTDIIHTDPRTWGGPDPAPTHRPWGPGGGLGDDDPSGTGRTNREFEAILEQARADGRVVHLQNQEGQLRMPVHRENLGNGWVGTSGEAEARVFNNKLRKQEREEYRQMYPNGCQCVRCQAKKANKTT